MIKLLSPSERFVCKFLEKALFTYFQQISNCIARYMPCLPVTSWCSTETAKRRITVSRKQHHTIAQGLYFSDGEDLGKTQAGPPLTDRAKCNLCEMLKFTTFDK